MPADTAKGIKNNGSAFKSIWKTDIGLNMANGYPNRRWKSGTFGKPGICQREKREGFKVQ